MKIVLESENSAWSQGVAESLSKVAIKEQGLNTLDTLVPVQLPAKELKEFLDAFHSTDRSPPQPAVLDEIKYLIDINAYLTAIFAGLQLGMGRLTHLGATAELGDAISREIANVYSAAADLELKAKAFMTTLSTGSHQIIKDSTKFKGGKDIIYSGFRGPNASPLLSAALTPSVYALPAVTNSYKYNENKEAYASEVGKALVATGFLIQELLFGEQATSTSSGYKRITNQHAIVLKWNLISAVSKILQSGPLAKLGIPILLPVCNAANTPFAVEKLAGYFSVLTLREPAHVIVLSRKNAEASVPDDSINICTEALALQPDIRFSFVVHMPKNFCEYITQTKGAEIPLTSLHTWSMTWGNCMFRTPHTRTRVDPSLGKQKKVKGTRPLKISDTPHYVFSPSVSDELIKRRKELNLYTEPGRCNKDGLVIAADGNLMYMSGQDVSATKNAKAYEALKEEALQVSYEAGTPLRAGDSGSTGAVYELASPTYASKIVSLKAKLSKFKGSAQAINWDVNAVVSVALNDPDHLVDTTLVGCANPKPLNLAAYLRSNINTGMRDMFSHSVQVYKDERIKISKDAFTDAAEGLARSSVFMNFAIAYNYFLERKMLPPLAELVTKAAAALKIASLDDEAVVDYELLALDKSKSIYGPLLSRSLETDPEVGMTGQTIVAMMHLVAQQASGDTYTNLARVCVRDQIPIPEHERYFNGRTSTVGEFSNMYAWMGGQIFYQATQAMLAISKNALIEIDPALETTLSHPPIRNLMTDVMPLCIMLGKYTVPKERDAILKEADDIKESETKFSESDLNIAGSKPKDKNGKGGMKLFPHQAEALTKLKAHPSIAILDISPGGGKTTIALADIAMLFADGLIKRPFVFAPNRLVRNWVEDLAKSFNGWNVIPVTTASYAMWGDERLTDMILNAPPNTIVVVGNSFISNTAKTQIVIGNAVDTASNSVEFCKKFQPDYVMLDESHRVRNVGSSLHKGIKSINMMTSVKYGRIGTGTLIQNVLSDVVGQTAIFNGQAFRTIAEFDDANKVSKKGEKEDYREDTPVKARRRLAEFATVISFKRKEWAFLLPSPIETFYTVTMGERINENGEKVPDDMGHKLQLFYDAVLKLTLEAAMQDKVIMAAMENKKARKAGKKGATEEDEDDSVDAGSEIHKGTPLASGISLDTSDVDALDSDDSDNYELRLNTYLQRIERILTDPFGDPELQEVADKIFGEDQDRNWATPKVEKAVERMKFHFKEIPWKKGTKYKPNDMVDYGGKSYIYRSELSVHDEDGEGVSNFAPDSDEKNWKLQIRGKIFVTCRYNRSVQAIYNALPPDLKSKTTLFYGDMPAKDREGSIAKFQTDDKCQILIANEQGVTEGHNFQMASRYIRVEAPWAPGELDQTAARVFRPDVGGEYTRQVIFLDWILCDNTLEVAKMGRLISKMLKRTAFDEVDNPKYYKGLNPESLPIISMSIDNLKILSKMDDLMQIGKAFGTDENGEEHPGIAHPHSYIGQYTFLVHETAAEFREMRQTKRASMLDVEPTPMPAASKRIEFTPWIANHPVDDVSGDGLVPLIEALHGESDLAKAVQADRKALLGQYVRCEFGLGTIVQVTSTRGNTTSEDDEADESDSDGVGISKVKIQLAQGGSIALLSPTVVFLATNVTARNKDKYNAKAPKITAADKRRTERDAEKAAKALAAIRAKDKMARARAKLVKVVEPALEDEDEDSDGIIEAYMYPAVYNQFLTIECYAEGADDATMKRLGFEKCHKGARIFVKNADAFDALVEYLEKKYTLPSRVVKQIDALHDSFSTGRGRKFQVELAPYAEFIPFHRAQKLPTKVVNPKKPDLHIYPKLLEGNLYFTVDLVNNPVFRKEVNKTIPGVAGKVFKEFSSAWLHFSRNKTEMQRKVAELRKSGQFKVLNIEEFKKDFVKLNLATALANK